ncbi:hypothetical protein [Labrenzia sp. OB1]|uniref:hypothetical protein n=1 Tax=Labrenzia sp. OB1 TaxID=1561204 RepID=UPI0007B271C0|nr:hypothetical protein [Labrenzia sp. OB1]KZM48318.1 hypothetical protein OA90_21520 [Labrenzia sp. OB1]
MSIIRKVFAPACGLSLLFGLAACAVGPGTPLVDALKTNPGQGSTSVPAPKGYRPTVYAGEASGLINPRQREATEAYLESLAAQ